MSVEYLVSSRSDVLLLDCCNGEYNDVFSVTHPSKVRYARQHHLDFVRYRFTITDRTAHWGRVLGISELLPKYNWVFYLDTDTVILDYEFSIRSLFGDKNIVTGPLYKEGHIGTNGMIFRKSNWNFEFLKMWYRQKRFISEPYHGTLSCGLKDKGGLFFEQSAFHYLYDTVEDVRDNVELVARKFMHSLPKTYRRGDFLIHVPGLPKEKKLELLRSYTR